MSSKNTSASCGSKWSKHSGAEIDVVDVAKLWAFKREWQRKDVERVRSGQCTPDRMSWFSHERARSVKLVDSSY